MISKTKMFNSDIASLKYPKDAKQIGRLGIEAFQCWYVNQSAQEMVFLGQFKQFRRFVFWHYTIYVKLLRLYYRIKRAIKI